MERDSDYVYRAVSIPWMSPYGMAIELNGNGFKNLFDELHHLRMLKRRSITSDQWTLVGLWRPRFEGEPPLTLLIFRSRVANPPGHDRRGEWTTDR
jgi:hypothetical protein